MNYLIVSYQAASRSETHTHTQIHKVFLLKMITRPSADMVLEMLFSSKKQTVLTVLILSLLIRVVADGGGESAASSPVGQRRKLQFPLLIPAPWNAGIVPVTAGFQSTLKCNWTLERQTGKGRCCQGQSLAWHAIARSSLIDLYNPPTPQRHSVSLI